MPLYVCYTGLRHSFVPGRSVLQLHTYIHVEVSQWLMSWYQPLAQSFSFCLVVAVAPMIPRLVHDEFLFLSLTRNRNPAHALTCLLTSVQTHLCRWVAKDAENKDNSLTSTYVLQRLELPVLTTRWHSCIESRNLKPETRLAITFHSVCIVDSWSHYQLCYIMHLLHCLSSYYGWTAGAVSMSPHNSIYFSENLISVTLRGKPRGALWMLLYRTIHICTFGHTFSC